MGRNAMRRSSGLARLLALAVASAGLAGCAMSERGPDSNGFVQQVRSVLGEQTQREVPVSQLVDARWEQLCMHRDGSLTLNLIELDQRHVLRVPFGQLTVSDSMSPDSLDGQCLQRDEMVRLRRHGNGMDAPIVLERASPAQPVVNALAQQ